MRSPSPVVSRPRGPRPRRGPLADHDHRVDEPRRALVGASPQVCGPCARSEALVSSRFSRRGPQCSPGRSFHGSRMLSLSGSPDQTIGDSGDHRCGRPSSACRQQVDTSAGHDELTAALSPISCRMSSLAAVNRSSSRGSPSSGREFVQRS